MKKMSSFLILNRHCNLLLQFKAYYRRRGSLFETPAALWHPLLLVHGSKKPRVLARARTSSCGAMAPPSGQHCPLLGCAVRAQEEGSGLVAGAGPGQESERTALLREITAHPGLHFPFCAACMNLFLLDFPSC